MKKEKTTHANTFIVTSNGFYVGKELMEDYSHKYIFSESINDASPLTSKSATKLIADIGEGFKFQPWAKLKSPESQYEAYKEYHTEDYFKSDSFVYSVRKIEDNPIDSINYLSNGCKYRTGLSLEQATEKAKENNNELLLRLTEHLPPSIQHEIKRQSNLENWWNEFHHCPKCKYFLKNHHEDWLDMYSVCEVTNKRDYQISECPLTRDEYIIANKK